MPHLFDLVKANLRDSAPAGRYTCPGCKADYGRLDVILLRPGVDRAFYACASCYRGNGGDMSRLFGGVGQGEAAAYCSTGTGHRGVENRPMAYATRL